MNLTAMRRALLLFVLLIGAPGLVRAGEPTIRNLSVRGLQIGATTTVVVDGDELGAAPRLLLPFPTRQQLKTGATKTRAAFDVTLEGNVEPGYYQVRVMTDDSVSLPAVIAVDRLPQRPVSAAVEQLPAALHGVVNGSGAAEIRFAGKAGQKIRVEIEAARLGSKLRPVVHLSNARGLQLAWCWPTPTLHGDARLETTLPETGTFILSIHDLEYAAQAPGFFRLRVGQWSFVDQVFPPVVARGRAQTVELLGSAPTQSVNLAVPANGDLMRVPLPKGSAVSGPHPFVLISPHAEVVQQPKADQVQELPAAPVGVSGRLLKPLGEDRYRIRVTPRTRLHLEVFAERYGSPLEAALVLRNEKGGVLTRAEDGPGTLDPVLDYNVPDAVTTLIVGVVDAQGRGGPRALYRLVVEPAPTGAETRTFQLRTAAQRIALPIGGKTILPIHIDRARYDGRIELLAEGLPAGVRLEGADIPEGADGALVTIQRGDAAAGAVITHWRGRTTDGAERTVAINGHPLERIQPWLATEIALFTSKVKGPGLTVDWRNLPADAGLLPAGKRALPIKVTKTIPNGVVRLTLLTSQTRPLLPTGQTDPRQSLRLAAPVELPATATNGELSVIVPNTLLAPSYDVAVQAELLSADKKTILAVAYTPVRRMPVRHQLVLSLDGPARIETTANARMPVTVKLTGKVERREGLKGDVNLNLTGIPPGVSAGGVSVKAGDTAFVLNVVLPPNFAPGDIKGLKLSATALVDPKQPKVRVSSRETHITLIVKPPAPTKG